MEESLVKIGWTGKAHGILGEIKCSVEPAYLEDFLKADIFFLKIRGQMTPFFKESVRGENTLMVKFDDVQTREDALAISGKDLFLRKEDLLSPDEREMEIEQLEFAHLQGFTLMDSTIGLVGLIEQVIEMPQQEMAVVIYRKKEVLIPLHLGMILQVDPVKKEVLMDLPEGLLEL